MNSDEITLLLGFAKGMDPQIAVDDLSISAWSNVLPEQITLHDAMRFVREHYQESDKVLKPAHVVGRYRMWSTPASIVKAEPSHDCMDGFVLVEEERDGQTITAAARCQICTPSQRR